MFLTKISEKPIISLETSGYDGAPRLGGGGHHLAAGADAEAEGAAAVGQVAGQLVGAGEMCIRDRVNLMMAL